MGTLLDCETSNFTKVSFPALLSTAHRTWQTVLQIVSRSPVGSLRVDDSMRHHDVSLPPLGQRRVGARVGLQYRSPLIGRALDQ